MIPPIPSIDFNGGEGACLRTHGAEEADEHSRRTWDDASLVEDCTRGSHHEAGACSPAAEAEAGTHTDRTREAAGRTDQLGVPSHQSHAEEEDSSYAAEDPNGPKGWGRTLGIRVEAHELLAIKKGQLAVLGGRRWK